MFARGLDLTQNTKSDNMFCSDAPGPSSGPLCPDSCHSLSLLQVMDGDETLVDHSAHDPMPLPLLSAQNSPPLEKLLTEFLQRDDEMNRHDE